MTLFDTRLLSINWKYIAEVHSRRDHEKEVKIMAAKRGWKTRRLKYKIMSELAVFKMDVSCGRMGNLEGVFVAKKSHVKCLIDNKIEVYYGEVLGKHSEIYGPVEEKEITLITEDKSVIDVILAHDLSSGFNPFDHTFVNAGEWASSLGDTDDMTVGEAVSKILDK